MHDPRVTGTHHEHLLIVIWGKYENCTSCIDLTVQQELEIKKYYGITLRGTRWQPIVITVNQSLGGLAQMVERPLSMREVPGSTPGFSTGLFFISSILLYLKTRKYCLFRRAFAVYYFAFIISSCPRRVKTLITKITNIKVNATKLVKFF